MLRTKFVAVPALAMAMAVVHAQAPQGQAPAGGQGAPAQGRGGPPPAPMAIKQIKPELYMVTGNGGNTTVRVTPEGLILVDTKNLGEKFYEELMAQVRTVSKQPVRYVFVTHVHQDHSGNIGPFVKAGSQVIAHEGLKRNLETGGPKGTGYESNAGKPAPPNVTYAKQHKVSLGKATAVAYNFGPGHTGGDTLVHFPDLRVVSLGDHFVTAQPNSDYPMGGSVINWARSLNEILKLDFDMAVPGHGDNPLTRADVQAFQQKMQLIADRGIALRKKGVAKEEIRQQIQAPELGTWQVTGVINDARLDAFYADLTAAAK
jgi:glyoxylase-like metal-dependent hydrolase (beta-lactamase superfamily II)